MKRKVRIGVLTSLLLAPAAIANANEVNAENLNVPIENTTIKPLNQVVALSVEQETLRAKLAAYFNVLSESSTTTQITDAKNIFSNMNTAERALFTSDELILIEAKIDYADAFTQIRTNASLLKDEIAKLTLTNQTLITDVANAKNNFDSLMTTLANTESAFKTKIPLEMSALDPLIEKVSMYSYTVENNKAYLQQLTGNINLLDSRIELVANVNNPITEIDKVEAALNASTFDPTTFKSALGTATDAYGTLSNDEKTFLNNYIPAGKTISVGKTLANAQALLAKVEKLDSDLSAIASVTTASDFMTKMKAIDTTYKTFTAQQKSLMSQEAKYTEYMTVVDLNNRIAKLVPSTLDAYRTNVSTLKGIYDGLSTTPVNLKTFVAKPDTLLLYVKDIEDAILVEAAINSISTTPTIKAITDARAGYTNLTATGKKVVNNLKTLVTYEKGASSALKVTNLIIALNPEIPRTFQTKTLAAKKTFDILSDENKKLVINKNVLDLFLPTAQAQAKFNALKVTSTTFESNLTAANDLVNAAITTIWTSIDGENIQSDASSALTVKQIADLKTILLGEDGLLAKVTNFNTQLKTAKEIDGDIATILQTQSTLEPQALIEDIAVVRAKYDAFIKENKSAKKLVKKYTDLTALEKQYQSILKVIALINNLDPEGKGYTKNVLAAQTAYDKLSSAQKKYVTNYDELEPLADIAKTVTLIGKLKPTQKDYRTQVKKARGDYTRIIEQAVPATLSAEAKQKISDSLDQLKALEPAIAGAEAKITKADAFDLKIAALANENSKTFVAAVASLVNEYKAMSSEEKKLLQKAKVLTDYEKSNKAVIKVINLIATLDPKSKDYTKKVVAARAAYDKLPSVEAKNRVYNYGDLTKVEGVASLISRIASLKTSNKTFIADVADIREQYEKLTAAEKQSVSNYDDLVDYEEQIVIAKGVMQLIREAVPTAENYLDKLVAARNAYNALESEQKKIVANIKDLTDREKAAKTVLNVIKQIDQLNPKAKDFAKKVTAVRDAYYKLELSERPLIYNLATLEKYEPAVDVINMIADLKPGTATFHEDVKAARKAYDALGDKQSYVNNYTLLISAEGNIIGASGVDELIKALKDSDPKAYVQKVTEARAAYKGLTKEQQKVVQYADILKEQEAYVKPVITVTNLIENMFSSPNLATQYAKVITAYGKLDSKQRTYVYNDYLISDLDNVIKVYNRINTLKDTDTSYVSLVQSIRRDYDALTASEKTKVANYAKLQEAEAKIEQVKKVDELIYALSPKSPTYFNDIDMAMTQYKALSSGLKKQLLYESALLTANQNKIAAQKVIKLIQDIDENSDTFETKVLAADTAFKTLTVDQQKLVSNYRILLEYLELI